jgi:alkylation response protein AidB-like acyl-CoA dehydrogenase
MAIDFGLDDHQVMLQQSASEFFRRRYPSEFVRDIEAGDVGYVAEHWREMADLGWLGITIPAQYGGGGGRFLDLFPLYEEMGRSSCPVRTWTRSRSRPTCCLRSAPKHSGRRCSRGSPTASSW